MDERMSRCAALDLTQAYQVAALEVSVTMLEFPERRVGRSCVKDVAHFVKAIHV